MTTVKNEFRWLEANGIIRTRTDPGDKRFRLYQLALDTLPDTLPLKPHFERGSNGNRAVLNSARCALVDQSTPDIHDDFVNCPTIMKDSSVNRRQATEPPILTPLNGLVLILPDEEIVRETRAYLVRFKDHVGMMPTEDQVYKVARARQGAGVSIKHLEHRVKIRLASGYRITGYGLFELLVADCATDPNWTEPTQVDCGSEVAGISKWEQRRKLFPGMKRKEGLGNGR